MRLHLRPLGVRQYESFHPEFESQPSHRWNPDSQQTLDGDGYGYDVRSFETDAQERLLEIRATCGHECTAFWLTKAVPG
jgi:hypothetical protein